VARATGKAEGGRDTCVPISIARMLQAHPDEGPMKILLAALLGGLLCAGTAGATVTGPVASAVARDKYLPTLQTYYAAGMAIYNDSKSDRLTDLEVDTQFKHFIDWANDAGNWISANISPAATARFTTWKVRSGKPHKLRGIHSEESENKYQSLTVVLPQLLDNLNFLMTPAGVASLSSSTESSK
jgi:hypothetical protein